MADVGGNDWTGERADILSRLATLSQALESVARTLEEIRHAVTTQGVMQVEQRIKAVEDRARLAGLADIATNHEKRLGCLEKLAPVTHAMLWVAGALGLSVIALIWALVTGQAVVVFN